MSRADGGASVAILSGGTGSAMSTLIYILLVVILIALILWFVRRF
jgi:hypothetical protein